MKTLFALSLILASLGRGQFADVALVVTASDGPGATVSKANFRVDLSAPKASPAVPSAEAGNVGLRYAVTPLSNAVAIAIAAPKTPTVVLELPSPQPGRDVDGGVRVGSDLNVRATIRLVNQTSRQALVPPRPQVRPAVLREDAVGSRNIGLAVADAKFADYGLYLKRLTDLVQVEWERDLAVLREAPPHGTYVAVTFAVESDGSVNNVKVDNHSTEEAAQVCVRALTARGPYGAWTTDMRESLAVPQTLTLTFYFE